MARAGGLERDHGSVAVTREGRALVGVEIQPGLVRLHRHRGIWGEAKTGLDRDRIPAGRALGHGQDDSATPSRRRDRALRAGEGITDSRHARSGWVAAIQSSNLPMRFGPSGFAVAAGAGFFGGAAGGCFACRAAPSRQGYSGNDRTANRNARANMGADT